MVSREIISIGYLVICNHFPVVKGLKIEMIGKGKIAVTAGM
jgi:hypothetical protein